MIKVLFLPEVVDQFMELAELLYDKGYLGFRDSALEYATHLFEDIHTNLPIKVKKDAPSYFTRYGKGLFYSSFTKNKHTTWYVFYSIYQLDDDIVFLVRYLGNNHVTAHYMNE